MTVFDIASFFFDKFIDWFEVKVVLAVVQEGWLHKHVKKHVEWQVRVTKHLLKFLYKIKTGHEELDSFSPTIIAFSERGGIL